MKRVASTDHNKRRTAELLLLREIKRENHLTREEATAEERRKRSNWKRRPL